MAQSSLRLQAEEAFADPGWRVALGYTLSLRAADNEPDPCGATAGGRRCPAARIVTLTGDQVRAACALLRWTRYDLQRATALPLDVVDRLLTAEDGIETTLAREIVVRSALRRAGVAFVPDRDTGLQVRLRASIDDEAN